MVTHVHSLIAFFQSFGSGLVIPNYGIAMNNRGSLFSLDGNNGNGMSNANNSNAIDNNINVSRSLVINASSSMGVSTNSGVEGEGSLLIGDIMPSFVSGAKTGKERRKSTKLKFKRKRK